MGEGQGEGNFLKQFFPLLILACLLSLTGCSKADKDDKPAAAAADTNAQEKAGVTIDADTQERIGLKTAAPVAAQWQPQFHAVGLVVDPLAFLSAVSDYNSARSAADASQRELDRTQKLADQNNASARTLETARATAAHDSLALASARATFTSAWGVDLAGRTDLVEFAENLATNDSSLVKLTFPVGVVFTQYPSSAKIHLLNDEANLFDATFKDDLGIDPATQTQTLLFSIAKSLPRSAAVEGTVAAPGDTVIGLVVPSSAVLRYLGLGWVYVQSDTNQFVRVQIPLDHQTDNGWFVPDALSATNQVVITGAQTILSTEMGVGAGANVGDSD